MEERSNKQPTDRSDSPGPPPGFEDLPSRQWVLDAYRERWRPDLRTEAVPLASAAGRVLAQDYAALYDQPVVRASGMDGVAVKSAMFAEGTPDASSWRLGVEYVRADTGDDFDDAYDAVIPIEKVQINADGGLTIDLHACPRRPGGPGGPGPGGPGGVKLSDANCDPGCKGKPVCDKKPELPITAGFNVRPAGSNMRKGQPLAVAGTVLGPADLAVLAAGGHAEVQVRRRPVVAFVPTGSELVSLGTAPQRGQTIDSNSILVQAMLAQLGATTQLYPIVRDDRAALEHALDEALAQADIVILNAGSSKGGEDFNATLLEQKGELLCHWIAAAPGRPLAAALIGGKPVLNVPGPPLATYYVLDWCLRALIAQALGIAPAQRPTVQARLATDFGHPPFMQILSRFCVSKTPDGLVAQPLKMGAAAPTQMLTASAQYVNELGKPGRYAAGEVLELELTRNLAWV